MLHDGVSLTVSKADVIRLVPPGCSGDGGMVCRPDTRVNEPSSAAASPCSSEKPAPAIVGSSWPDSPCFCFLSPVLEPYNDDSLDHLLRDCELRCLEEPDHWHKRSKWARYR